MTIFIVRHEERPISLKILSKLSVQVIFSLCVGEEVQALRSVFRKQMASLLTGCVNAEPYACSNHKIS